LSYAADLIRIGFGEPGYWSPSTDALALIAFAVVFLTTARVLHQRTRNGVLSSCAAAASDSPWAHPDHPISPADRSRHPVIT
jgi:hypothetical protein